MFAKGMIAVVAIALLSGCVVRDRERTVAADPHHDWWTQRHAQEPYDRTRAEREHRDWCARTPDRSCEGWH